MLELKVFSHLINVILPRYYLTVHYQERTFVITSKPKGNGFKMDPFKIQDPGFDFIQINPILNEKIKRIYPENLKKKSGVPFESYLLNSTAYPAHFHSNWAGLAVLFSR